MIGDDHDDNDDKVIPLTPTCHEWRRAGALRLRTVRLVQQHRFVIKPGEVLAKRKSKNYKTSTGDELEMKIRIGGSEQNIGKF